MCAKRIANSGIKRVIYDLEYSDLLGQTDEIFSTSHVKCLSMNDVLLSKETLEEYLKNVV
jgi:deoxycytidylate deaminase